jgi:hypothetical protein
MHYVLARADSAITVMSHQCSRTRCLWESWMNRSALRLVSVHGRRADDAVAQWDEDG